MKSTRLLRNPFIFFTLISIILTAIWFRGGESLGGGEIGTPFYNLNRMYAMSVMAWSDRILGSVSGLSVGGAPYYKFFSIFQNIGIPGFLLQASFFFTCLFLSLISLYALTGEVFPKITKAGRFASAIFYVVNPFALVNIWNRFLPNPMLFYSFLPLSLFLYIHGLKTRKYYFAILNMILATIFSMAFIGPSQTIIFWAIIFLLTSYYFVFIKKEKFVIFYFLASISSWFIFNFFWISQELYFRFSASFTEASRFFFTSAGNLETFNSLSQVLGKLSGLFLLRHEPFFTQSTGFPIEWPVFYSNFLTLLVQWAFLIAVLFVAVKRRREKWAGFLLFLFFVGIFASKGNAYPLGDILDFLFKKIPFLEFFRNPFEKAGLILPLSLSPLVALLTDEVEVLSKNLRPGIRFLATNGTLLYLVLFLGFPFWTGLVFTSGNPPANDPQIGYQVAPPAYYKEADKFLSGQPGIFRFITFPLGGEGIFNTWGKGYTGVEQSGVLFSTSGVSYNTTIPYYFQIVGRLERLFQNNVNFFEIIRLMNIKYLVFRPDFDFRLSGMVNPDVIQKSLDNAVKNPETRLTYIKDFGKLKIYKYDDSTFLPKIYAANEYILNNNPSYIDDVFFARPLAQPVIYSVDDYSRLPSRLAEKLGTIVVHSENSFKIDKPFPAEADDAFIFPHVSTPPDSKYYPLILFKERLVEATRTSLAEKVNWELMVLGKRLKEAQIAVEKGNAAAAKIALNRYFEYLPGFLDKLESLNLTAKQPWERIWHEGEIFRAFSAHIFVLDEMAKTSLNKDGSVSEFEDRLENYLGENRILPLFKIKEDTQFPVSGRSVYRFDVLSNGEYEILIPKTKNFPSDFGLGDELLTQLDKLGQKSKIVEKGKYVSFGKYYFDEGVHEISFNQGSPGNLLSDEKFLSFNVSSEKPSKEITIPFDWFDKSEEYSISFEYKIVAGSSFRLEINQDVDKVETKGLPRYKYFPSKDFSLDEYWHDWSNYQTSFIANPSSSAVNMKFVVQPWNNCKRIFGNNPQKCDDQAFSILYDRPTQISIRNLKIVPNVPKEMVLLQSENITHKIPDGVTFEKINNAKYVVHIKGAREPFTLVFSELYDGGWINSASGKHFLVNGYANGWWVEKTGDYDLILEYSPQRLLNIGYLISGISFSLALLYVIIRTAVTLLKR